MTNLKKLVGGLSIGLRPAAILFERPEKAGLERVRWQDSRESFVKARRLL